MEEEASTAKKWSSKWQYLLDKASPHIALRWLAFTISFFAYVLRVYLLNGWYIVTYGLGIYLLSQLIGFITPQVNQQFLSDYMLYSLCGILPHCFHIC